MGRKLEIEWVCIAQSLLCVTFCLKEPDRHTLDLWKDLVNLITVTEESCIDIGEVLILSHMIRTWVRQTALVSKHTHIYQGTESQMDPPLLTNCVFLGTI